MLIAGALLGALTVLVLAWGINNPDKLPWNKK